MYKELFTWGLKDPQFKFSPEPDLPRPWRFYADWGFWLIVVILGTFCVIFRIWQYPVWVYQYAFHLIPAEGNDLGVAITAMCILAFHPILCLWIAWDSYRWNFPNRLAYILLVSGASVLVFVIYLMARADWVMEAQRQARMHKLGMKDE